MKRDPSLTQTLIRYGPSLPITKCLSLYMLLSTDTTKECQTVSKETKKCPRTRRDAPAGELGLVTIKNSAEIFLSAMIFDEVFERHPELKGISMEHGAFWVPSWLHAWTLPQEISDTNGHSVERLRSSKTPPQIFALRRRTSWLDH